MDRGTVFFLKRKYALTLLVICLFSASAGYSWRDSLKREKFSDSQRPNRVSLLGNPSIQGVSSFLTAEFKSMPISFQLGKLRQQIISLEGREIQTLIRKLRAADEFVLAAVAEDSWLERDHLEAFDFAAAYPLANVQFLHKILTKWAEVDPGAAFNAALSIGDTGKILRKEGDVVFSPSRMEVLESMRLEASRPKFLKTVIREIGRENPANVLSHLKNLPDLAGKKKAVAALGELWASHSIGEARNWASTLASLDLRDEAMSAILVEQARMEPERSSDLLRDIPDALTMISKKAKIVEEWSKEDPVAAYSWIVEHESGENADSLLEAAMRNSEPEMAARFLAENVGHGSASLLLEVVSNWSQGDPEAVLTWANNIEPSLRGPAIGAAVEGWAKADPEGAKTFVSGLPDAYPWERQAVAAISRSLGKTDPSKALLWLKENADAANKAFGPLSMELVDAVAAETPKTAAEIISDFPPPLSGQLRFREVAIDSVVTKWAQTGTSELVDWANTLSPDNSQSDMVFASMASFFESRDAETAAYWSSKIQNESYRKRRSFGL